MIKGELCRLPEEVVTWRRQAALEALAPLIRLLGGKAFSSTGIHQPLLNEVCLSDAIPEFTFPGIADG